MELIADDAFQGIGQPGEEAVGQGFGLRHRRKAAQGLTLHADVDLFRRGQVTMTGSEQIAQAGRGAILRGGFQRLALGLHGLAETVFGQTVLVFFVLGVGLGSGGIGLGVTDQGQELGGLFQALALAFQAVDDLAGKGGHLAGSGLPGGVTGLGGFGLLHGQVQVFGHMQDLQPQHGLEVVLGTGLLQQQDVQTGLLLQIEIFGRHAADLIHDQGHVFFPDLLQHALVRLLGVFLLGGQGGHVDAVQIEILQSLGTVTAGQTGGQGLIQRVLADEGGDGVLVSAHALGLGDVLQDAFLVRGQLFGLLHDELLKSRMIPACDLLKVRARRSPLVS